jgi:hypothetical protein
MTGLDKVAVLQEKVQGLQDKVADLQVRRDVCAWPAPSLPRLWNGYVTLGAAMWCIQDRNSQLLAEKASLLEQGIHQVRCVFALGGRGLGEVYG